MRFFLRELSDEQGLNRGGRKTRVRERPGRYTVLMASYPKTFEELDEFLAAAGVCITPDIAPSFVDIEPDQKTAARLKLLSDRAETGGLLAHESAEYATLREAADFAFLLTAKAEAVLKNSSHS